MPKGDPDYWRTKREPLNLELQSVVRGCWADQPPVVDLQLQYIPHYAGKHCLESVRLSRLANEGGAHAVAIVFCATPSRRSPSPPLVSPTTLIRSAFFISGTRND